MTASFEVVGEFWFSYGEWWQRDYYLFDEGYGYGNRWECVAGEYRP